MKAAGGPPGGADGKAPELPSIAAPKPTGKDGGGGGSGGGGGGAAGGGKGMSGAAPKPDAAKGEPGATAGAGPSGSSLGSMSAGPGETAAPDEPAIQPVIGTPRVGTTTVNGGMFKLKPNGPAIIPTVVNVTPTGHSVVGFRAKLAIDADGDSEAYRSDKTGQSQTALLYKNGRSLDPTRIPFIVVPTDFGNTHPNVKLGDYATVSYGPKTIYAIVGDRGPAGVLGEASIAVARSLGINADPNRGGSNRPDFEYRIVAGSKDPQPAESAAQIQARGRAVFETAGAPVR
ncbi:MAG: glycoside hydrolase family 75 protein [Elusimicrobiota bacterium]|nr:MAG: glycoside hydrolase family 75 protein [Elusimicrobiota bacterium]